MVAKQKILIVDDDNNIAELISVSYQRMFRNKDCKRWRAGFKRISDFSPQPDFFWI